MDSKSHNAGLGKAGVMKPKFYRFRNVFGEIVVHVAPKEDGKIYAGYALCNPNDFNLPRETRVHKGHGKALKRWSRKPLCVEVTAENEIPKHIIDQIAATTVFPDGIIEGPLASVLNVYHGPECKCELPKWFQDFKLLLVEDERDGEESRRRGGLA